MLVALLALAPAVQAQAGAAHPDHAMAGMQQAEDHAQPADCCPETGGDEHARHAACSNCAFPCLTLSHGLIDTPLAASPFGPAAAHGRAGQRAAGLSTAPDLEPPTTRS